MTAGRDSGPIPSRISISSTALVSVSSRFRANARLTSAAHSTPPPNAYPRACLPPCVRAPPLSGKRWMLAALRPRGPRARMISLQEELDWRCYRLYDLLEDALEHTSPPPLCLGERAFEIVMARRMAAGDLETSWFERHRSTPITELPAHWPANYRAIVERRITVIESDPTIGIIERPEYKRRWSAPTWEDTEQHALRLWLLDQLEARRFWPRSDPRILSAGSLADAARHDAEFLAVAELYTGRPGFALDAVVAELVAGESVPFLAALRYTDTGRRKRADWEATWEKQRAEDAIDAGLASRRHEFVREAWARAHPSKEGETVEAYSARIATGLEVESVSTAVDAAIAVEAKRLKQDEVGDIPVPPKYKNADFQSQDFWRLRGGLRRAEGALRLVPSLRAGRGPQPAHPLGGLRSPCPRPRHRRLVRRAQGHRWLARGAPKASARRPVGTRPLAPPVAQRHRLRNWAPHG